MLSTISDVTRGLAIGAAIALILLAVAWIARLALKAELWHWRRRHTRHDADEKDQNENPKDPD